MIEKMKSSTWVVALISAIAAIIGCKDVSTSQAASSYPTKAPSVADRAVSVLGTVQPSRSVDIKSRVEGIVVAVLFSEGQTVGAGAELFSLDESAPNQLLRQSLATKSKDEAILTGASITLGRDRQLFGYGIIPKQQLEAQETLVLEQKSLVEADQAQVQVARLQLEQTHIRSPISGTAGFTNITLGSVIHPSDVDAMVKISQMKPALVVFAVSPALLREYKLDSLSHSVPIEIYDEEDKHRASEGMVVAVDNQIDPDIGLIKCKAIVHNKNGQLWPREYVNVHFRPHHGK